MMWSSIKLSYCNIHSTLDISFINLVMSNNMQHSIPIGVSLPEHLVKRIDVVQGRHTKKQIYSKVVRMGPFRKKQ